MFAREIEDRDRIGDALVRTSSLIGDAEAVARADHGAEFVDPGGERAHRAALVQDETDLDRVDVGNACAHRFGIRHLRDAAGIDEARDLDALDPRGDRAADQFDLVGGCHGLRLVLQSVARRHLDDLDAGHSGKTPKATAAIVITMLSANR